MHKTIFSYLWQGDSNVIIFLVISGFFITFVQSKGEIKFLPEKLGRKLIYVFVPAFIIVLLSIGCHFTLYTLGMDSKFIVNEIGCDLKKLFFGGVPHYAYQIWYIHTLMMCYIIAYIYIAVCNNNKYIRRFMYPVIIAFTYVYARSYVVFIIGMVCGEICGYLYSKDYKGEKKGIVIGLIAFVISPFLYNEYHLTEDDRIMLAISISIFMFGMIWARGKITDKRNTVVDWLDKQSFSFYLVHVLFLDTISNWIYNLFMRICSGKYEMGILLLDYAISLIGIWILAYFYEKLVISNVMKCVDKVIDYLKSKKILY